MKIKSVKLILKVYRQILDRNIVIVEADVLRDKEREILLDTADGLIYDLVP